ncbi:uncharacterized protein LOC129728209 [Wyeomyia smithii]|uniref:uncharacterized protein LOC129728209 n=1 Tax=Wyeomyia smithii TaxID=174621 RepID=UPI002467C9E2|nr:uncharacterized protein LOC129728209 [Wyeomyia smithii]
MGRCTKRRRAALQREIKKKAKRDVPDPLIWAVTDPWRITSRGDCEEQNAALNDILASEEHTAEHSFSEAEDANIIFDVPEIPELPLCPCTQMGNAIVPMSLDPLPLMPEIALPNELHSAAFIQISEGKDKSNHVVNDFFQKHISKQITDFFEQYLNNKIYIKAEAKLPRLEFCVAKAWYDVPEDIRKNKVANSPKTTCSGRPYANAVNVKRTSQQVP